MATTVSNLSGKLGALLLLLALPNAACNISASSDSATSESDDCRELDDKKDDCYYGHKGDIYTITKTFDSASGTQEWTDASDEVWGGFKMVFESGSFSAPITFTARLHLNQGDTGSHIGITADGALTGVAHLTPPSLIRTRMEEDTWRFIYINHHQDGGGSTTLSAELSGRTTADMTIKLPGLGRFTFTKRTTPPIVELRLEPEEATVAKGLEVEVKVIGIYSNGKEEDVTSKVSWVIDNPLITEINTAAEVYGTFAGLEIGESATMAEIKDDDVSVIGKIIVGPPVVISIKVTPENATIFAGITQQFTALATYSDGTEGDITDTATWVTDDTAILTASNEAGSVGLATAVAVGETFIKAKMDDATGGVKVTVIPPYLVSVVIDQRDSEHQHSQADIQITATGTYTDGSTGDVTTEVTWASDDEAVATVEASTGKVTTADDVVDSINLSISVDSEAGTLTDTTKLYVIAQDAEALTFVVQPSDVVPGAILQAGGVGAPPGSAPVYLKGQFMHADVTIAAVDSAGKVDKTFTGDVTLSFDAASASPAVGAGDPLPSFDTATSLTVSAVEGVARFGYLRIMENCDLDADDSPERCAGADNFSRYDSIKDLHTQLAFKATATDLANPELVSATFNTVAVTFPSGGDGSGGDPFFVDNMEELDRIRLLMDKSFELTQNIDAASAMTDWHDGEGFLPIGKDLGVRSGTDGAYAQEPSDEVFYGSFDGKGFSIANLTITSLAGNNKALFSRNSNILTDFSLLDISVIAPNSNNVGTVAGENKNNTGLGLTGDISKIKVVGTVEGNQMVGGIVGVNISDGDISDVIFSGNVSDTGGRIGGIAGLNHGDSTIKRCIVVGNISSSEGATGTAGIIGENQNIVSECLFLGDVSAKTVAGGVVGRAPDSYPADLTYSLAKGQVTAVDDKVGGIIGVFEGQTLKHNAYQGNVYAANNGSGGGAVGVYQFGVNGFVISYSLAIANVWTKLTPLGGFAAIAEGNASASIAYSASASSVIFSPEAVNTLQTGNFIGKHETLPVTYSGVVTHSNSPDNCLTKTDTNPLDCLDSATGYLPPNAGIAFAKTIVNGRKIGNSDTASYRLKGHCPIENHGATIELQFIDAGGGSKETSGACQYGSFSIASDLSNLAEGSVQATAALVVDSCTAFDDCAEASVNLNKDTAFCADDPTNGDFAGGAGSSGDPYLICTEAQLDKIRDNLSDYYKLKDNIAVSTIFTKSIGNDGAKFTGGFEGDNYRIDNLAIAQPGLNDVGLFGSIDTVGTIANLTLENAAVMGQSNVGILAGTYNVASNISNINVSGVVLGGDGDNVGGLIGRVLDCGTIANVILDIGVVGRKGVGGVAGSSTACDYSQIAAYGTVISKGDGADSEAGGIIGNAANADLSEVASYISVTAVKNKVGGIVGVASSVDIADSLAQGYVLGAGSQNGGISGSHTSGTVTRAYASGSVLAANNSGGLFGSFTGATLTDSFTTSIVGGAGAAQAAIFDAFAGGASQSDNTFLDTGDHLDDCDTAAGETCAGEDTLADLYDAANAPMSGGWDFATTPIWQANTDALPTLNFHP